MPGNLVGLMVNVLVGQKAEILRPPSPKGELAAAKVNLSSTQFQDQ
jgi:hypothetical protein